MQAVTYDTFLLPSPQIMIIALVRVDQFDPASLVRLQPLTLPAFDSFDVP